MVDVLFVAPDLRPGGVGRCVAAQIEALPALGLSTALFCARAAEDEFSPAGAAVTRGLDSRVGGAAMQCLAPLLLGRLMAALRSQRPALVCSHGMFCNLLVAAARIMMPDAFRSVAFEHNSPRAHYGSARLGRLKRMLLRAYGVHDCVVGVSRGVVRDLVEMVPSLRDKSRHLYNGIALADVRRQARVVGRAIVDDGTLHVVALGRLVEGKGFDTLVRAAQLLDDPGISIIIVGEGPLRADLESQIERLRPGTAVLLPGHARNPFPVLAAADIFVSVSERESFGMALVEAMCLGVPVIATDCPCGPAEILQDGRFGDLVPVGDAAAVARAIRALADEPARRRLLACLGPRRAADFSLERHCHDLAALIQPLLQRGKPGRAGART
ncbi:glycosyltransferase [Bordetella ansorpii]|uniref:Glycosyltransferase n=1 Tax=Bordetella ansorpii TaxID=288768 RepID=A0A157S6I8_9BORD|nr:glycosyltransferase [Bordetella ansorpii]SAI65536.1 glycosyltransferase [Bordetella ansorpii]